MYMKNSPLTFYYRCPGTLGILLLQLDNHNRVVSCVFANRVSGSPLLGDSKEALDAYFIYGTPLPKKLVSQDLPGTPFQKSVWQVISKIPQGKTVTYTDLAKTIGSPAAVRAVGTACGKNPVALFIPCHRIVRTTGEDGGYSWGAKRKLWILKHEQK
jgi:O-6-methylguanine DNA methyltransferase